MSSKNNVCIYLDATEKRRIKPTRISDVVSVWGTRIKRLDEYNLTGAIQFVLYVALLSKKIAVEENSCELNSSLMRRINRA